MPMTTTVEQQSGDAPTQSVPDAVIRPIPEARPQNAPDGLTSQPARRSRRLPMRGRLYVQGYEPDRAYAPRRFHG